MNFCYKCGAKLGENDIFCIKCGTNNEKGFMQQPAEKEEIITTERNKGIIYKNKDNLVRESEGIRGKLVISNNRILIVIILILVCTGSFFLMKAYNTNQNFKKYLNEANSNMSIDQYDKAITSYKEALKYKDNTSINKQIELAKMLKTSKAIHDTAMKQMSDKQYLDAIDTFEKVDKQDTKRYADSLNEVIKCKKSFITDNLYIANDDLKNNRFEDANKCLDNIFKVDASNASGLRLKEDISKAVQKHEDEVKAKRTYSIIIKDTDKALIPTGCGDVKNNELWIKYSDGNEELLVSSKPDNDMGKVIGGICNPKLSLDRQKIYFMCAAWTTSGAIHVVDIKTKNEHFVCAGNSLSVIQTGDYIGKLIVNQHRYHDAPEFGSYNNFYIISEQGKQLKDLGEDSSVLDNY